MINNINLANCEHISHLFLSYVSIVDFEQINVCWVAFLDQKLRLEMENTVPRLMNILNVTSNTTFLFDIPQNILHNTLSKTNLIVVANNHFAGLASDGNFAKPCK